MTKVVVPNHGPDHCPGGPDPIPCLSSAKPWVALTDGATTIPTGTWMPIPFTNLIYDPLLVTQGDIFDWDITDTGDTGNDRYELTTREAGWYSWELLTHWDSTSTGGTIEFGYAVQRITFDNVVNFPMPGTDLRNSADWMDADVHTTFEMINNQFIRGSGELYVPAVKVWLPTGHQVTGVDRGLSGMYFRVKFEGPDDSTAWTYESV